MFPAVAAKTSVAPLPPLGPVIVIASATLEEPVPPLPPVAAVFWALFAPSGPPPPPPPPLAVAIDEFPTVILLAPPLLPAAPSPLVLPG